VKEAIVQVAKRLGNTPAISRKCYVHPSLIDAYVAGRFTLPRARRVGLSADEAATLAFLTRKAPGKRRAR